MPDPVERARHFQNRAEECLRLAEVVESAELRTHYREMAACYAELAKAETVVSAKINGDQDVREMLGANRGGRGDVILPDAE